MCGLDVFKPDNTDQGISRCFTTGALKGYASQKKSQSQAFVRFCAGKARYALDFLMRKCECTLRLRLGSGSAPALAWPLAHLCGLAAAPPRDPWRIKTDRGVWLILLGRGVTFISPIFYIKSFFHASGFTATSCEGL